MSAGDDRAWIEPWRAAGDEAHVLERELRREICPSHPLFGVHVIAIGRSSACDDVLFELDREHARFVVVHLTYRIETSPEWPHAVFYATWDDWRRERMVPDHDALRA